MPDRDSASVQSIPWFGNNNYLENFLDSIGYPSATNRIVTIDRVRYHVPIKFWVYRSSAGTGGPSLLQLQTFIDNLNRYYNVDNNTLIGFYMKCVIGYIDDDTHLDVGDAEAWSLIQSNKEAGCINIHVTNTLSSGSLGISYRARLFGVDAIFLNSETYNTTAFATTIAHEVGHYFELDHTQQFSNRGKCLKEAISRTRTWPTFNFCWTRLFSQNICEATGDFLKDTPADPDLNTNNSCSFLITGKTDPWGDQYETPPSGSSQPDTRNLMSYNGLRSCRGGFSRLQIAVMLYSIVRGKSKGNETAWKDTKSIYDDYEPDNTSLTARNITKGEIQDRNFHQQYNKPSSGVPGTWSNCDIDWVRFVPTASETVSLATYQLPGYTTVDTRLTLFNASLTQLAQNDNISTTNLYSNISYAVVAGQTYFIRVENLSGNITGYYRLLICNNYADPAAYGLNGATTVCPGSPQTYQVTNLPAGAMVSWSTSPAGFLNVPSTGNPITASSASTGTTTLTATVSACGGPFTVSKTVRTGGYGSGDYPVSGSSSGSCGSYVYFYTNQLLGATSYTWFYPGNWSASGQGTYSLSLFIPSGASSGNYQVGVRVANACDAGGSYAIKNFYVSCYYFGVYTVSPNPASSDITIATSSSAAKFTTKYKDQTGISQINVYDQYGHLLKKEKFGDQNQVTVKVNSLSAGVYIIEIISGNYKERHKLSVLK